MTTNRYDLTANEIGDILKQQFVRRATDRHGKECRCNLCLVDELVFRALSDAELGLKMALETLENRE